MALTKASLAGLAGHAVAWTRDAVNGRVHNTRYLTDHFVVGSDQLDDAGGTDRDNRMFFNKAKGAFRAGKVTGIQWDNVNVGASSAAFGEDCKASGQGSLAVGIGANASGSFATALGYGTSAIGAGSVAAGSSATASGAGSFCYGEVSTASGQRSFAWGKYAGAKRVGQWSRAGHAYNDTGDAQANHFVASAQTTTATPTGLAFDFAAPTLTGEYTNVLTVPVNRAHRFKIEAVARRADVAGDVGGWTITGTIIRGATGNATFISTPSVVSDLTAGAVTAGWTLAVSIDTVDATNNYLAITATGAAGATIRWVADLTTTEVG